ncbi:MAG: hypothetical protein ACOCQ1_01530 [Halanaerobiaceae bacterium]
MTSEKQGRHRRPPKNKTKCCSQFEQILSCEFEVTFEVEIPDVELLNVTCVSE